MYYQEPPSYYFSHTIIKDAGVGGRTHAGRDVGSTSQKHLHTSWSAWNFDPKTPGPNKHKQCCGRGRLRRNMTRSSYLHKYVTACTHFGAPRHRQQWRDVVALNTFNQSVLTFASERKHRFMCERKKQFLLAYGAA